MSDDEIRAEWLSYDTIRSHADEFLAEHHPSGELPVPIELIIEKHLGMDIVPLRGLRSVIEAEGFTTSDRSAICIDHDSYDLYPQRYRFTLAHEVGHLRLHRAVFGRGVWDTIDGWKAFLNSIPDQAHQSMEFQANNFAGLVLVPRKALLESAGQAVDHAISLGFDFHQYSDLAWATIAAHLAKKFDVSSQVIEIRLRKDEIPERFNE